MAREVSSCHATSHAARPRRCAMRRCRSAYAFVAYASPVAAASARRRRPYAVVNAVTYALPRVNVAMCAWRGTCHERNVLWDGGVRGNT